MKLGTKGLSKVVTGAIGGAAKMISEHVPVVLTVVAVVGAVTAVVDAVKQAPAAKEEIEEAKKEIADIRADEKMSDEEKEQNVGTVKKQCAWKLFRRFAPVAIALTASIACTIGLGVMSSSAQAGLAAVTEIANQTKEELEQRKDAEKAVVGEEKAKEIDQKSADIRALAYHVPEMLAVMPGQNIYIEKTSGRAFAANPDKISVIEAEIQRTMEDRFGSAFDEDRNIHLNDIYELFEQFGFTPTSTGEMLGIPIYDKYAARNWHFDKNAIVLSDGRPAIELYVPGLRVV